MLLGALVSAVENLVLVALLHGGQRHARRTAWLATVEGSAPRGDWREHPDCPSGHLHSVAEQFTHS